MSASIERDQLESLRSIIASEPLRKEIDTLLATGQPQITLPKALRKAISSDLQETGTIVPPPKPSVPNRILSAILILSLVVATELDLPPIPKAALLLTLLAALILQTLIPLKRWAANR